MSKGIIDPFILQGWHYQQFYYLNKDWILNQTKQHNELDDKFWNAFMGGVSQRSPISDRQVYDLMYPHYIKAIERGTQFKGLHRFGLTRHLATYLFWGFEDIRDDNLITLFLGKASPELIKNLTNFISSQKDFMSSLDNEPEKDAFRQKITDLWSFILKRFQEKDNKDANELKASLTGLMVYFKKINEDNVDLIKSSAKFIDNGHYSYDFLEELDRLKEQEEPETTASYIESIISEIPVLRWLSPDDQQRLIDVVIFLYKNDLKDSANKVCNRYSMARVDFLRSTHDKYNQ